MITQRFSVCALLAGALAIPAPAFAARLSGQLTTADGQPVSGGLVTVFNEAKNRKTTAYTAPDGRYAVTTDFDGRLSVRARVSGFEDVVKEFDASSAKAGSLDFSVSKIIDAQALSDTLTASAHLTKLQWDDPEFEPGDVRATSGGETRLIRCAHGADVLHTRLAARAAVLWDDLDPGIRSHREVRLDETGRRRHRPPPPPPGIQCSTGSTHSKPASASSKPMRSRSCAG